jgi:hypothetical protein
MSALRIHEALEAAFQDLVVQYKRQYLNIPCLLGGVGIGKTEGGAQLSVRMSEVVEDSLLFEPVATGEASDPTDTAGVPWVISLDAEGGKEHKVLWVLNRAAYQACKAPTLLLFDDIDKATPMVVNSLLNLFVHRRFKDYDLHPKSLMMCAGNRTTDDIHANALSESIRTRVTIIEVEPSLEDFVKWATADDEERVHPLLVGFLQAKPDLLHKPQEGVYRFPTPRSYREATLHMQEFTDPKGWKSMLSRKLGDAAANDFWSWYTILRKIDVDHILDHGKLKEPVSGHDKLPAEVAQKMGEFAAVFAVVDRLNQKIKASHGGLEKFVDGLSPELRVAFLLQMKEATKREFRKHYAGAAGQIMAGIIKDQ